MNDELFKEVVEALRQLLPLLNNIECHDNDAVEVRNAVRQGEAILAKIDAQSDEEM